GFYVDCRSHLFAICKWAELLTSGRRPETSSIPLRSGELAPPLEDVTQIDWTPMRVDPIPPFYAASSRTFRMTVHLICMFLVMPYFSGRVRRQFGLPESSFEITPPWTPIIVNIADEDVYLREMTPWMEEWRGRIAHVIGEEEEESILLSLYEEKYKVILRDVAALTDHGASLRAERDSAIRERDSIAEDLESLRRDFEGMREARDMGEAEMRKAMDMAEAEMRKARDMVEAEHDSIRDELERVRTELERV
ncbi:hypothetical protein AMTR_s00027p00118650, partial [Amborella trichopoda]